MTVKQMGRLEYNADFSPDSDATLSYVTDPATDYTLTVSNRTRDNLRAGIGFDLSTDDGFSAIINYERYESKGNAHTDTIYFTLGWVSNKETKYILTLNGSDNITSSFDIVRNINGFGLKLNLDNNLSSSTSNQQVGLNIYRNYWKIEQQISYVFLLIEYPVLLVILYLKCKN